VAFKVILTDSALSDFESLMNWSRDHYAASSEKFGTALLNHVDLLKAFPFIGRPVQGFVGVRQLLHSPLYVYYRVDERREAIEVLRFWHISRRPPLEL
jgi:plasmid stabilization system protein ParE